MTDRYIPNPHDGIYRPRPPMQGEREAEERGNPYTVNTPAWHVWNDGYQAAVSMVARKLIAGQQFRKDGE